jgi:pyruvate kinase
MKTKIVATLGPASDDPEVLSEMIQAGVDVCRLNFSHGSHDYHKKVIETIKKCELNTGSAVAILADLQGPKIRLGDFEGASINLLPGDIITFTTHICKGTKERVYISYTSFANDVKPGETILVDDGKMAFKVLKTNGIDEAILEAVNGGVLMPRKGVNLPDTLISLPSLTEKDLADLSFILDHDVHWIALSFVRSAKDIIQLRELINSHPCENKPLIVAKIEKPQAVKDIDAIIEATDAIMIARGDLGVEMPMQMVPMIQKKIIRKCQQAGKPLIVATQMMEAMIDNIRPTRAEVSDVANSVLDGADALMLSGETSVGKYPVETIAIMQRIISQIEADDAIYYTQRGHTLLQGRRFATDAVLYNAIELASTASAEAIVVVTHTGYSAFRLASHRPKAGIYVFSNNNYLLHKFKLVWGIHGFYDAAIDDAENLMRRVNTHLLNNNFIFEGQFIINILSTPAWKKGTSNTVRLGRVGELR